jgi:prephenate dehydrogenase (NADP+)
MRLVSSASSTNSVDHAQKSIQILPNGHLVSRASDWIIYSVEAELIEDVVKEYGPSTKVGAIVGGQTSCKAPELTALDEYLPADVEIVSCHSLHGPAVDPTGQPLVVIKHRASQESVDCCVQVLKCLHSKIVYLSGEDHDRITADTQAVTHAAFLSMGTAWAANNQFPWEISRYVGGIENVKINITLRIYANKWHVYAGLAILNPAARRQIRQYAESVTELFKLMLGGHREELAHRIKTAGAAVFSKNAKHQNLLLGDDVLDKFSLSKRPEKRMPNNHLSLLAIVDCWWKLGIVPYDHMICSTPVSCLRHESSRIYPSDICASFSASGSVSLSTCSAMRPYSTKSSTQQSRTILSVQMIWNLPLLRE